MTLDPKDWSVFRRDAHAMLDAALDKLENAREGDVWTPVQEALTTAYETPLPREGAPLNEVMDALKTLMPLGPGNTHPRFFGWVHGAGAPSGLISAVTEAAMNVNAGGRNHIAPVIEQQVIRWATEMMGMPEGTSGLIVSGTSMATIIALKVARDQALQQAGRGSSDITKLVGYTSEQTHSCVGRAFDVLGIGKDSLRQIPCNAAFEIDTGALLEALKADRDKGLLPFAIIGTAGAVNMGAIDDLDALADIAGDQELWLHVDGAFGATANIGQRARGRLTGLSRADSLAFDFHKWLQVNYDAGCVLIRDGEAHRQTFANRPEYLRGSERGLAGGDFWAVDYGPELSRGFRALKVWVHIKTHGMGALAAVIDRNIEQAQYLESLIKVSDTLEMLAPVPLNICCFRYKFDEVQSNALNHELVVRLQESGMAVTSSTLIQDQLAIRVNITNHRTRKSDLELLIDTIERIGAELMSEVRGKG